MRNLLIGHPEKSRPTVIQHVQKLLTPRFLVYLYVVRNVVLGLAWLFVTTKGITSSIIYQALDEGGALKYFALFVLFGTLTLGYGLVRHQVQKCLIGSGAILVAMLWVMFVYVFNGYYDLIFFGLLEIAVWIYVYLASSVGSLWRDKTSLSAEEIQTILRAPSIDRPTPPVVD